MKCVSEATYYQYQAQYIFPAVETTWKEHLEEVLTRLGGKDLVVCGDGCCDSAGSSLTRQQSFAPHFDGQRDQPASTVVVQKSEVSLVVQYTMIVW